MAENDTSNDDATGREDLVKVNLFTTDLDPVGEYYAPLIPRVGEWISWEGVQYKVTSVMWEGLPESPTVQVRLGGGIE